MARGVPLVLWAIKISPYNGQLLLKIDIVEHIMSVQSS